MKILFLDIDGPMIPHRAYFLPNQTSPVVSIFDPCASSMLLRLLDHSGAKIVISSSWGLKGRDICIKLLEKNGISQEYLHLDWITPRKFSSTHEDEIRMWLDNHPEIDHSQYLILDDAHINLPNVVKVSMNDGFLFGHFLKAAKILGIEDNIYTNTVG